jgi:hypothetical protein
MIIKTGERLKLVYLIKNKKQSIKTKNVRFLILIILLSVFVCACNSADNNSTSNVVQQKAEAAPTPKNDELKWEWCIKPDKYSDLYFVDNDLIAVSENYEKYVIVNTNGEIVIPFEYSSVESFEDGFALVNENENTFFINKKGENIFDKVFEDANDFSDGFAAVKKDGLWGFIDNTGNMIIKNQFDQVKSFNESFAAVEKNNEWGVINNLGELVIDFQYDEINDFHEGFASVAKDGKWGFIDKSGRIVAEIQFDQVENYSEGFAAVMKNNKWGFIDKSGKISIAMKYDDVGKFSEGKASVKLSNYNDDGDQWAYIDIKDNIVIDFYPYDAAGDQTFNVGEFNEGLAFVTKTVVSIIDNKGNNIFLGNSKFFISSLSYNSEYDAIPAYTYTDDTMKNKKYGLMGLTGNQRLEPIFDYISGIYGDYVVVENIVDGESKMGIIKIYK